MHNNYYIVNKNRLTEQVPAYNHLLDTVLSE